MDAHGVQCCGQRSECRPGDRECLSFGGGGLKRAATNAYCNVSCLTISSNIKRVCVQGIMLHRSVAPHIVEWNALTIALRFLVCFENKLLQTIHRIL